MQGGVPLSRSQARRRYVHYVVRRRWTDAAAREGSLEGELREFIAKEGARLFLIGSGGRGKTTSLRHFAGEGARRAVHDAAAPVPVCLQFTTFDSGNDGFKALLDRLSVATGLDVKDFKRRWLSGPRPMLLLLDS